MHYYFRSIRMTSAQFMLAGLALFVSVSANCAIPTLQGLITDDRLTELSGMTSVSYNKVQLWAINDGGHGNFLYAISTKGAIVRQLALPGVENVDVEDIDAFRYKNRQLLAIGDIGDNGGVREDRPIYIIAEPKAGSDTVKLRWTVRFRFPDRRHDCESLFVDVKEGYIYLVNKRTEPPILYRIPLKPKTDDVVTAELIGVMPGVKAVKYDDSVTLSENQGKYATQPTSAALSCDRRTLSLLTYTAIYHYRRGKNQTWADAFVDAKPEQIALPPLPQAESISYSSDCRYLYVGSERTPSPIWRFSAPKAKK
jgi:hypothetical protein